MSDRARDVLRPLLCLAVGVAMFALVAPRLELWNLLLSFGIGCVGTLSLGLHRRAPVTSTVIAVVTSALTPFATPAMWTSLYLVALRQPRRVTRWMLSLALAAHVFLAVLFIARWHPQDIGEVAMIAVLSALVTVAVTVVGLLVRRHRDAAAYVETVTHDERDRIIGAVHDNVGHRLALLSIYSHSLEHYDDLTPPERADVLGRLRTQIDDAGSALTSAVGAASRDVLPASARLDELIADVRSAGVSVGYRRGVDLGEVSQEAAELAVDFAREALTNAMRHGGGGGVRLNVESVAGWMTCTVESTVGRGSTPGAGTGLARLRRRAEAQGGSVVFVVDRDLARCALHLPVPSRPGNQHPEESA